MSHLKKKLLKFLLIVSLSLMMTLPAKAALCHQTEHHTICILNIKRSAKNYWEYRAAVKIDQDVRPMEIYNCREQHRITKGGDIIPFESDGVGTYICRTLKR